MVEIVSDTCKLREGGNSLVITVPKVVREVLGVKAGDYVAVTFSKIKTGED